MTEQEYNELTEVDFTPTVITHQVLKNKQDRTLIYGYTCDRWTYHVFLKDLVIYVTTYFTESEKLVCHEVSDNGQLVPNKRVYAECCDFEFCKVLKRYGIHIPFTTPNWNRPKKQFYGRIE